MNKILYFLLYSYIFILALLPSKFKLGPIPFNGDSILMLIILVYIISIVINKEMREKFIKGIKSIPKDYTIIFFIGYILAMMISTSVASDVKVCIKETLRMSTYFMLFFIIKNEITDQKVIKNLLSCNTLNIIFLCCYGIFSFIFKINTHVYLGINRIQCTFENPNNFAMFLMLSLFSIIMISINYKKYRWHYAAIALLMMINIALTGSRNALLGIGIGSVLLILFFSWKFIVFVGGIGAVAIIIPQLRSRILQVADMSQDKSRFKLWRIAIDTIKDHPLRGVGNGNYPVYYKVYEPKFHYIAPDYYPDKNVHPHSIILKVQSETGILGLGFFVGLIVSIFFKIARVSKYVKDDYFKTFYKGFLISFIVFIMMNMVDNYFSAPKVIAYFWIFIAIAHSNIFKEELQGLN